ncbi:MAG: hypothetical protein QOD62_3136, partial [Actinomycetota bacterium]|nr:hypothetical protein [Actinomycetota bacterium]
MARNPSPRAYAWIYRNGLWSGFELPGRLRPYATGLLGGSRRSTGMRQRRP